MAVKKFKPTTPGRRFFTVSDFADVDKKRRPERQLVSGNAKTGGRNSAGRMTNRNRGGGHKRLYRKIDFRRDKFDVPAKVAAIEYDPNRSARIALLHYVDGEKRYIIAANGMEVGQQLMSGTKATPTVGTAMYLTDIPLGTVVHNIELRPGQGAAMARSAGSYAQLLAKEDRYAVLKMPSSETRMVLLTCIATIGTVSNSDHSLEKDGKAGRTRWQGRRPRTRSTVKNPVDHPMGGGEGRATGGHPRSKNGIMAKGQKTRSKKKASNKYIIEKRKK